MRYLELKVPPVLVFLLTVAGMWGFSTLCAICRFEGPLTKLLAVFFGFISFWVATSALYSFYQHRTTVHPSHPDRASALVKNGIFRLSRNPMYLSLALLLAAFGLWLGNVLTFSGVFLFLLYITWFQIIPEERALRAKFGDEFVLYCEQTRRWI